MSQKRREIPGLEEKIVCGQKQYVRYKEGAQLFSMGERSFMDLAHEADAVRKIRGVCLVNVNKLSDYIETMYA